jgi:glutaredoxin
MSLARPLAAAGMIGLAAAWSLAAAQPVFRIVGPDGRVTFSDRPPTDPAAKASPAPVGTAGGASDSLAALPFELRNAASRYPVVLYTGLECAPCQAGRDFLSRRGIPFSEKTVTTQQDIEALKRLSGGGGTLPFVTVGAQQLKGYSEAEWTQFLDAAGYPKTSQLPSGYRPAPATPLVVVQQAGAPGAASPGGTPQRAQAPAPAPAGPSPSNPAGIQF